MTHSLKRFLFRLLGLNNYLSLMQKTYLLAYRAGWLKKNESYKWHYFVKNLLQKDDVVIDIGANLGYFSHVFIQTLGESGQLYCVEPVAPYRRQLEKITRNKSIATVFPFALGNENKASISLGMPAALANIGYLRHGTVTIDINGSTTKGKFSFVSSLRKADEVFVSLQRVDYIKCDIEGYETVVFPELKQLLQQHQPLVQLETWGEQLPVMLAFFNSLGFEAYQLHQGQLIHSSRLPPAMLGSSDLLFVPLSRMERVQAWIKKD